MNQEWEELGCVGHDGYLAFADAAIPIDEHYEALRKSAIDDRVMDCTGEGAVAVAAFTEADGDVPVEVLRDEDDFVTAVRLCWTNDVDQLDASGEGAWRYVAELPMESETCLAWDPYHGNAESGVFVELARGRYAVEAFYTEGDCLALRLIQGRSTKRNERVIT